MADLGNQKIKDTYQLVLQTDTSGNLQNLSGGTPSPFIVNGNLRYADGTQSSGYVLISDGSGNASWGPVAFSGDVYVTGGTIEETTIQLNSTSGDTISIPGLCWSSSTSGHISNSGLTGNVGVGTSTPNEKLTVVGDISGSTDVHVGNDLSVHNDAIINGSLDLIGTDAYIKDGGTTKIALGTPNILKGGGTAGSWKILDGATFGFDTQQYFTAFRDSGTNRNTLLGKSGGIDLSCTTSNTMNLYSTSVLLGKTAPSQVSVSDVLKVGGDISGTTDLHIGRNITTTNNLTVNGDTLYGDSDTGNVGVGNLNPSHKLTISGNTFLSVIPVVGQTITGTKNDVRISFNGGATTVVLLAGMQLKIVDGDGITQTVTISSIASEFVVHLTVPFPGSDFSRSSYLYSTSNNTNQFAVYSGSNIAFQVSGDVVMSGTTDLLDIFASSGITNQDVYWSANTDGSISNSGLTGNVGIGTSTPNKPLTVVGDISGTTDLYLGSSTHTASTIVAQEELIIKGHGAGNDYLKLNEDNVDIFINGAECISIQPNQITINSSTQDIDTKIMSQTNGTAAFHVDANTDIVRLNRYIQINGESMDTNQALYVSGSSLFYSGGSNNTNPNAITAVGDISGAGRTYIGTIDAAGASYSNNKLLVAQSNGEVEYLTTAELKADIADADYWSGNTDGSISPSGNTDVRISGNTYVSGDTHTTNLVLAAGGYIMPAPSSNTIKMRAQNYDGEMLSVGPDLLQVNMNSGPNFQITPTQVTFNSIGVNQSFRILTDTGNFTVESDGEHDLLTLMSQGGTSIGGTTKRWPTDSGYKGTAPNKTLQVNGRTTIYSGGTGNSWSADTTALTVVGDISGTTDLHIGGNLGVSGNTYVGGNVISANEDVYMFSNRGQGQTDNTHWYGPNYQGIYNYSWSKDYGDDTEVLTLDRGYINTGLLVPYDCVLTGFFTIGHTNTGTVGYSCGLWYITQSNLASSLNVTSGAAGDATLTLAGTIGTTVNPGDNKNPLTLDKRGTMSVVLTAGSMIYPRVGDSTVVTDTTWNVYLKRT